MSGPDLARGCYRVGAHRLWRVSRVPTLATLAPGAVVGTHAWPPSPHRCGPCVCRRLQPFQPALPARLGRPRPGCRLGDAPEPGAPTGASMVTIADDATAAAPAVWANRGTRRTAPATGATPLRHCVLAADSGAALRRLWMPASAGVLLRRGLPAVMGSGARPVRYWTGLGRPTSNRQPPSMTPSGLRCRSSTRLPPSARSLSMRITRTPSRQCRGRTWSFGTCAECR